MNILWYLWLVQLQATALLLYISFLVVKTNEFVRYIKVKAYKTRMLLLEKIIITDMSQRTKDTSSKVNKYTEINPKPLK